MTNLMAGTRQQEAEQFNAAQVQQMEQFQEQMSNTAYQRSKQDMLAAGLNPILMTQRGGASVPGGGAATTSPAPVSDMLTPAVNSALAAQKLKQDLAVQNESIQQMAEQAALTADQRNKLLPAQIATQSADAVLKVAQAKSLAADAAKAGAVAPMYDTTIGRWLAKFGAAGDDISHALSPVTSAAGTWLRGWFNK